jgi:hypothetical protein
MTNVIDVEALADMPKLFTVRSVANVDGYQSVQVDWFVNRDFGYKATWLGVPWTAFIADVPEETGSYGYTQSAIEELFTEDEAKMLVEYLKKIVPDDVPTVTPFKLPVRRPWIPLTQEDCGMAFPLFEREDYSLSFRVSGFSRLTQGLFLRKEKSGRFVVYKDGMPITTPFADRGAAAAWKDHLLPQRRHLLSERDLEAELPF